MILDVSTSTYIRLRRLTHALRFEHRKSPKFDTCSAAIIPAVPTDRRDEATSYRDSMSRISEAVRVPRRTISTSANPPMHT